MTIRAKIQSYSGEPLDNASVELVDATGKYLGEGVRADNTGKFIFTSNAINGNYVKVSYSGMQPLIVDTDLLTGTSYYLITLYPIVLDEAGIDFENNPLWLLVLLFGGWVLLSKKKKK